MVDNTFVHPEFCSPLLVPIFSLCVGCPGWGPGPVRALGPHLDPGRGQPKARSRDTDTRLTCHWHTRSSCSFRSPGSKGNGGTAQRLKSNFSKCQHTKFHYKFAFFIFCFFHCPLLLFFAMGLGWSWGKWISRLCLEIWCSKAREVTFIF